LHGRADDAINDQSGFLKDRTVIVDCPPGSACSVMESIKDADFCLMVAEPTVFGIHNLDMVYRLVKLFGKSHALVVNKDMSGGSASSNLQSCEPVDRSMIEKYCSDKGISIITSIPYHSELAMANSEGLIAAQEYKKYLDIFKGILDSIEQEVNHEAAGNIKR
jgi:MinD superfamily P-loop ATPase